MLLIILITIAIVVILAVILIARKSHNKMRYTEDEHLNPKKDFLSYLIRKLP